MKTDVSVKTSLLGSASAHNDKQAETITKLKDLLRESRDAITQLPIVVEANVQLTVERDQLLMELASAKAEAATLRKDAADAAMLRIQCQALSEQLADSLLRSLSPQRVDNGKV